MIHRFQIKFHSEHMLSMESENLSPLMCMASLKTAYDQLVSRRTNQSKIASF